MEWNRHKMLSISQESQRYVAYEKKGFRFMKIPEFEGGTHVSGSIDILLESTAVAYKLLRQLGYKPEIARSILPNCTMTSVYYSALTPFWDHFLKMRLDKHAHPHISALAEKVADVIGDLEDSKSCGWLFTNLCRS